MLLPTFSHTFPHSRARGDEYCAVDEKTGKRIRLTIQEKERIYLDAVQSYYYSGRELLKQSEFDLLKVRACE